MPNRITLCLSGGGFRASIFHLGILDFLCQTGRIKDIVSVYGVSGGALTAAHFAHRFAEYTDREQFPSAALELLALCNKGIIDRIAWSSLIWQRLRSSQLIREIDPLFVTPIPSIAKPTYVLCSSLSDTSQFAVELQSRRLYRLSPELNSIKKLGTTSLKTSTATAMSACFPLAFEPFRLNTKLTGLDRIQLGPDHMVADGGIVDNFGIAMAQVHESTESDDHLFLISDAGQIFDEFEREQEDIATVLSPMRTISYLMTQHANAMLERLNANGRGRIAVARLADGRKVTEDRSEIDAGLIQAALRIRTNFDSFSPSEIVSLYRLGILVTKSVFEKLSLGVDTMVDEYGLIRNERLGKQSLGCEWETLKIDVRTDLFSRTMELFIRKPGFPFFATCAILFLAFLMIGIFIRLFW